MAYQGILFIEGKQYNVLECEYEFEQPIDNNFKPSAYPSGGLIHFSIYSTNEDDTLFHDWMMSMSEVKEGTFVFPVSEGTTHKKKTVGFKYAHCIRLHEYFNNQNEEHIKMKITLSAAIISFGGKTIFKNRDLQK